MHANHAVFSVNKQGDVSLRPNCEDCKVLVNGSHLKDKTPLNNNDRYVKLTRVHYMLDGINLILKPFHQVYVNLYNSGNLSLIKVCGSFVDV